MLQFPAPPPAPDAAEPSTGTQRGPRSYAPKALEMICAPIRRHGLSDDDAAETVGMSAPSLWRWKHDYPEVRQKLKQARQECRIRYLERIERFAERNDALGFRASIWLAERIFPGDYAKTQRERWACETAEEQRDRHEEREVGNAIWAEKEAARNAEAKAKKAAEAEAAKPTAASAGDLQKVDPSPSKFARPDTAAFFSESVLQNVKNASGEAARTDNAFSSESDLQNVKNSSGDAEAPSTEPVRSRPENAQSSSEDDLQNVKNPPQPNARPLMEAIFGACGTDLHNVKNPRRAAPAKRRFE